jgi:hypothetical protein
MLDRSAQLRSLARSFVVTVAAASTGSAIACRQEPDPVRIEAPKSTDTGAASASNGTTASVVATGSGSASASATDATIAAKPESSTVVATKKRKRTSAKPVDYKYPPGPAPNWSDLEPKNPSDADGRVIYVDEKDLCYVEVPPKTPPKFPGPPGLRMMDHVAVDCPALLDDPAWDECQYGPLMKNKTKAECYCMTLGGNPPPPPRLVSCPKK